MPLTPTSSASVSRLRSTTVGITLVGVGLSLRLWGLRWGAPALDFNPDEELVSWATSKLSWHHLDPEFYSYSGLTFYLNFLTRELVQLFFGPLSEFDVLLVHRSLSVVFGTLCIVLAYQLVRRMGYGRRAGWIAAGAMAVAPLHVWDSHFGTVDVGLTFWCGLACVLSLAAYRRLIPARWLAGGLCVGAAIGVKFNGAFAGLPFLVALALAWREGRVGPRRAGALLAALVAGIAAASLLTSPFSFINLQESLAAFLYEYRHVHVGHVGFDLDAPGWQYHPFVYQLLAALPFSLGVALYGVAIIAAGLLLTRWRSRRVAILTSFVVPYLMVIGSWTFVPLRYLLPLFPFLMAATGIAAERAWARWRWRAAVPLTLLAAYTLTFTVSTTARFTNDTREASARWIEHHVPPGASVFLAHVRNLSYLPAVDPARYERKRMRALHVEGTIKDRMTRGALLTAGHPPFVVMSSLDYARDYRRNRNFEWDLLRRSKHYRLIHRNRAWFLNREFYETLDPMFGGYFVSPDIEVYLLAGPPLDGPAPPLTHASTSPQD
jgi:4-amino-4-deoxy-L-arabinose transferase-like glycosyltransferase